ncbi:MAG: segregation/condensation protein A [Eubacteriaceae bacterium]|nr:segregation/condensation protein A [Eubacteriaceae bacterium]
MNEENILTLEKFSGPLDLLLSLIAKNEVDIFDIPISEITKQYMNYIYAANSFNIELAAEFVVMASTLIEIKSRMMLPKEIDEETGEEIDPREELVARLIEYSQFKAIASHLAKAEGDYSLRFSREQDYFEDIVDNTNLQLTSEMILKAMSKVLLKRKIRIEENSPMLMETEEYSVEVLISDLQAKLREKRRLTFDEIISSHPTRAYMTGIFLAILEMYKMGEITISQEYSYSDITVNYTKDTQNGQ